jgi:hypothetical protein
MMPSEPEVESKPGSEGKISTPDGDLDNETAIALIRTSKLLRRSWNQFSLGFLGLPAVYVADG